MSYLGGNSDTGIPHEMVRTQDGAEWECRLVQGRGYVKSSDYYTLLGTRCSDSWSGQVGDDDYVVALLQVTISSGLPGLRFCKGQHLWKYYATTLSLLQNKVSQATCMHIIPLTLSMLCKSSVTIMCRGMVFWRYPLDYHICTFRLSSCKYTT